VTEPPDVSAQAKPAGGVGEDGGPGEGVWLELGLGLGLGLGEGSSLGDAEGVGVGLGEGLALPGDPHAASSTVRQTTPRSLLIKPSCNGR
jgi:hypothetical protein